MSTKKVIYNNMKMAMNISPSTDHSVTLHNSHSVYYLDSLQVLENEE
jgi:hypothetical protein